MKKALRYLLIIASFLSWISSWAQILESDYSFKSNFDRARNFLLESKTQKAIPILLELAHAYPSNSNISYLLGICYTESNERTDKSIYYLEKAKASVSEKYAPNSHLETRAPIFLYYFLVVANCQNQRCGEAYSAFESFRNLYGLQKQDYYILDALNWIDACTVPEEMRTLEVAASNPMNEEIKDQKQGGVETELSQKRSYGTKKLNYSTQSSIYGVQVGATSRVVPIYTFEGLKNVNAYLDQKGMIRYVMGRFSSLKQAQALLAVAKEQGYPDAFVVDINKETKFQEEIILYNDQSLAKKKTVAPSITFSVQIGAFKDTIPHDLAVKYTQIEDITSLEQNELTFFKSGSFKTYKEASLYKDQLNQLGIPGCFVIAVQEGKKIPIEAYMRED